jgi:hypothetical protein
VDGLANCTKLIDLDLLSSNSRDLYLRPQKIAEEAEPKRQERLSLTQLEELEGVLERMLQQLK